MLYLFVSKYFRNHYYHDKELNLGKYSEKCIFLINKSLLNN